MKIEFDFKEFLKLRKSGATVSIRQYLFLKFLYECNDEVLDNLAEFKWEMLELNETPDTLIQHLQEGGYLKIIAEEEEYRIELRKKALDLFPSTVSKGVEFDAFWDKYHSIVKEWRKTDRFAAEKVWKRMTIREKQLAFDNIQPYYDSAKIIQGRKVVHKARTYLTNKLYNDEFGTQPPFSNTGTINELV